MTKQINGTNCGNCRFSDTKKTRAILPVEQNKQGGLLPKDDQELEKSKVADLVTFPGTDTPKKAFWCEHKKMKLWVNERMCCAFWDADGCLRSFGNQQYGK